MFVLFKHQHTGTVAHVQKYARVLYPTDGTCGLSLRVDSARCCKTTYTQRRTGFFLRHLPPSRPHRHEAMIRYGADVMSRLKYGRRNRDAWPRRPYMIVRWPATMLTIVDGTRTG